MDLRMPGATAWRRPSRSWPPIRPAARVLVLTTYDTDADILRAVEAGATGYLLKDTTPAALADAIRAAARGETVLAPAVAERLVTHVRGQPRRESLSARETEILAAGRARPDQRRDRPRAVHQRGHGEDAPAAGVRQAGRVRPHRGGDHRDPARPAAAAR